jgi:hypothetical protein
MLDPALPRVLIPFHRDEALTVCEAAHIARKSAGTVRQWAARFDIGRRVGGGDWMVSYPALLMHLDGDEDALRSYLAGDRQSDDVRGYFERASAEKSAQYRQKAQIR